MGNSDRRGGWGLMREGCNSGIEGGGGGMVKATDMIKV